MILDAVRVKSLDPKGNINKHFKNVTLMVGLTWIQEYIGIGYDSGIIAPGQLDFINDAVKSILKKMRPYLIPLVEMYIFTDNQICSAIGNSYGDIYE